MRHFSDAYAALRRKNRGQYALLAGCSFFSVLLITAYVCMMRSPTILSVLPEGGDSRKQVMMVFVLAVIGCAVFTAYAAGLFFRQKSRETGVFLALGLEILRIPVMPFAIGLYLPIYLNATIMIGGVVRMVMDARKNVDEKTKEQQSTDGTLYCAGMIAGEGLVGILLAIFAVFGINTSIGESVNFGNIGGVILMVLMIASLLYFSLKKKKKA